MKESTIEALREAAEEAGWDVDFRDEYAGRCMGGATTGAVVTDVGEFAALVGLAAANLASRGESAEDLVEDVRGVRTDQMGRSTVFY